MLPLASAWAQRPGERMAHYTGQIEQQNYRYPRLAAAVSAVETGYWNPAVGIMQAHNLFAFKENSRRNYIAVRPSRYVVFASDSASLADYGEWETHVIRKYRLGNAPRFHRHLTRHFCRDPLYARKLQQALRTLQPYFTRHDRRARH